MFCNLYVNFILRMCRRCYFFKKYSLTRIQNEYTLQLQLLIVANLNRHYNCSIYQKKVKRLNTKEKKNR